MADLDTGRRRAPHPRGNSWLRADTACGCATRAANRPAHQHEPAEIRHRHGRFAALLYRRAIATLPNFRHRRRHISRAQFLGGHRLFQRFRCFLRWLRAFDEYRTRDFSRRPTLERAGARRFASSIGKPRGHAGAWSPDSKQIAYGKGNEIFIAKSDGGDPHELLPAGGTASDIRWSPDGSVLRFTVNDPKTNNRSIWQASANGSNLHALLPSWSDAPNECCGKWTPDGKYFVFQAQRDATADLWAINERGSFFRAARQEPVQLTTGPMNVGNPVPSRDGKKLFVQGWQPRGELLRYDAKSKQLTPYLSGISAMGLDFSHDGEGVAYNDASDGTLWRSKVDGTQKLQLVFPPMLAYLPRWSPNGKQIAFFGHPPGEPWQIYVVPAEGGAPELIYRSTTTSADPNWSPDGKSLAFGENSLNNQGSAVYVLDLETRQASKLPGSDGLYSPRWSPDGRYLAAIPLDSLKLMLFDFTTQKWTELASLFVAYPTWSRDGRYLYFDGILDNQESYFRAQVSSGKLERIFSLKDFQAAGGAFGNWSGLAPDESPLVVRDASIQEIYSLDWDRP